MSEGVGVCLQAAGGAFSILRKGGATSAMNSIIPTLLQEFDSSDASSTQASLMQTIKTIISSTS